MTLFYLVYLHTIGGTLKSRRFWLTVAALFYLIPLRVLNEFYVLVLDRVSGHKYSGDTHFDYLNDFMEIQTEQRAYQNEKLHLNTLIYTIWIIVAVGLLVYSVIRHIYRKHCLVSGSRNAESKHLEALERLKDSMGIRRKVQLVFYRSASPMTLGFFRPVIILPEKMWDELPEGILKHELTHTKNGDMLRKIVLTAIINIHWFNPFAYRLMQEYEKVYEMICDDNAVESYDGEARIQYARRLLQESKAVSVGNGRWAHHLTKEGKFLKERIENIMEKKNIGRIRKCVGSAALVVSLFVSSLTALAYEDVHSVDSNDNFLESHVSKAVDGEVIDISDMMFSVADDMSTIQLSSALETILYDEQFVDNEGNIYEVNKDAAPYSLCKHSYLDGFLQEHTKYVSGNCIVEIYKGQICEICGHIIVGDFVSSHTYAECPH